MNILPTFEASIYLGLKEGYGGMIHSIEHVEQIIQGYVDDIEWCLTVTPTKFVYTDGNEPGVIIGAINYPRFPQKNIEVLDKLTFLANWLMEELNQQRCTIVTTVETYLLENDEYEEKS